MKKFILFIFISIFIGSFFVLTVSADDTIGYHEHSNNYEYDIDNNCYDLTRKINTISVSSSVNITVLTHGLGSRAYAWSNSTTGENDFVYHKDSLINSIRSLVDSNVYLCSTQLIAGNYFNASSTSTSSNTNSGLINNGIGLNSLQPEEGIGDEGESIKNTVRNITYNQTNGPYNEGDQYYLANDVINYDFTKHVIIVYDDPSDSTKILKDEYTSFLNVIDDVVVDFYNQFGVLPKINLIGHSRGGLVNFMYALEHPDMVNKMISIGTPYNGSILAEYATDNIELIQKFDLERYITTPGMELVGDFFSSKINQWNENYLTYYENIDLKLIGCYSSPFYFFGSSELPFSNTYDILTAAKNYHGLFEFEAKLINLFCNEFGAAVDLVNDLVELVSEDIEYFYFDGLVETSSQIASSSDHNGSTRINNAKVLTVYKDLKNSDTSKLADVTSPQIIHNTMTQDTEVINCICSALNYSNYMYYDIDNTSVGVKAFIGNPDNLVTTIEVPNSITVNGVTKNVVEIAPYAFSNLQNNININTIELPSTIQCIKNYAFCNCNYIQTIRMPVNGALNTVEDFAFYNCDNLEYLTLSTDIRNLNLRAVINCPKLTEISIDEYLFSLLGGFNCHMNNGSVLVENNFRRFYYGEIIVNCSSKYKFDFQGLEVNVVSINILDSELNFLENIDISNQEEAISFSTKLERGTYYYAIEFEDVDAFFLLSYGLDPDNNIHELEENEEKNILEHYHNSNAYKTFQVNQDGYYLLDIDSNIDEQLTNNSITIWEEDLEEGMIYVNNYDILKNSLFGYFSANTTYRIDLNNVNGQIDFDNSYIKLKLYSVNELVNIELDIDDCYHLNKLITNNNYQTNEIKKIQYDTHIASEILLKFNSTVTQYLDIVIIKYNQTTQLFTLLNQTTIEQGVLFSYIINPELDSYYYFGFINYVDNNSSANNHDILEFGIQPYALYNLEVYTDPIMSPNGTEVTINGGNNYGTTITTGFTRLIFIKEDGLAQSRLNYYFETSDENILRVTNYGTVLALNTFDGDSANAYIRIIKKTDASIVGRIDFLIIRDTSTEEVYLNYGADVREQSPHSGTEVTIYGSNPVNPTGKPLLTVHLGNTRLICLGDDAPSKLMQDYNFEIIELPNSDAVLEFDSYGKIRGMNYGRINLLMTYKYNQRFKVLVEIEVI